MSINSIFARFTNPQSKAGKYEGVLTLNILASAAEKKGLRVYRCGTANQVAVSTDKPCRVLGQRISLEDALKLIKDYKIKR